MEKQCRKSLDFYEWRSKGKSDEDLEEKNCRESLELLRDYLSDCVYDTVRNMDSTGHSG